MFILGKMPHVKIAVVSVFDHVLKLFSTSLITSKIQLIHVDCIHAKLYLNANLYLGLESSGGCEASP